MPEIIRFLPEIINFCRRFLSLKTDSVKKRWQDSDDLRACFKSPWSALVA
jgi:hypothetical protein